MDVERYLLLGLRLGRHVDGFVDSYYGPPELKERVDVEEPAPPAELAREAYALLDGTGDAWLRAQLDGLAATAERLDGRLSFRDEIRRCYGVAADPATEAELAAAHDRLDELLPGGGDLRERYRAWRRERAVPREAILPALARLETELRARTAERFGLPEGERLDVELVENEPWGAFNYYLGGLRSRVVVNTDVPLRPELLPDYVAHEVYPGHHTEHAWKERLLVEGEGRLEETIFLTGTPQALVAEGIATNALAALGPVAEEACAAILAELGAGYDLELVRALREAEKPFARIAHNVALMLHEEGRGRDEAGAFALRWNLRSESEVEKLLDFGVHPAWRAYVVVYVAGERLVEPWAAEPARFRRLLTERLTTSDLR